MLNNEDCIRLQHMLDAAQKAIDFTEKTSRARLDDDEQLSLSLVRLLEIVGEAAKNVSEETRKRMPSIPWREIAGTRDRLIHGYFDVDLNIVWKIIKSDLPQLVSQLQLMLSQQ
jgi:uncharacterized protein with HEPN domain